MKKKLFTLLFISLFSCLTIIVLYVIAERRKINENHFTRVYNNGFLLEKERSWPLLGNAWKIAGASATDIFLGSRKYINLMVKFNLNNIDTQFIKIDLDKLDTTHFSDPDIILNDSCYYLVDGNLRRIFKGETGDWRAKMLASDRATFNAVLPISGASFIYRVLDRKEGMTLAKKGSTSDSFDVARDILKKQQDGLFSKDGILLYDSYTSYVVYTYTYRNEFVVTDSSLHLLYRGHTIDTNSVAKIKLSEPNSSGIITMAAPPLVVNRKACVNHGYLYINSSLRADNEAQVKFDHISVIDVYNLKTGKYYTSFYIPFEKNLKFKDFRVEGQHIIVLYDDILDVYKFNMIL